MKIIGLGHASRVGKDTFADMLVEEFKRQESDNLVVKRPFAWKLKQIAHDLYAWDGMREPEWYDLEEGAPYRDTPLPTIGKTPVEIWVALGTPAIREQVYQNTWIDYVLKGTIADMLIIPDVRFPNEIDAIRQMGGTLIHVVRPGVEPRNTVADRALLSYDGWDYRVNNHKGLGELRRQATWLVGSLT